LFWASSAIIVRPPVPISRSESQLTDLTHKSRQVDNGPLDRRRENERTLTMSKPSRDYTPNPKPLALQLPPLHSSVTGPHPRASNLEHRTYEKKIGPQKWARQQAQFCHVGCVGLLWCYLVVFLAVGGLWILHRIGGRRCAALWLWCYTWAMADARVPGGRPKRD